MTTQANSQKKTNNPFDIFVIGARKGFTLATQSLMPNVIMAYVLAEILRILGVFLLVRPPCWWRYGPLCSSWRSLNRPLSYLALLFRWCRRSSSPHGSWHTDTRTYHHLSPSLYPHGFSNSIYGSPSRCYGYT